MAHELRTSYPDIFSKLKVLKLAKGVASVQFNITLDLRHMRISADGELVKFDTQILKSIAVTPTQASERSSSRI